MTERRDWREERVQSALDGRNPTVLADLELLADAVETVCRRVDPAYRRLNIEILGNTDVFLHCHIWPRYEWEPSEIVGGPVWWYDRDRWRDPATALGPAHDDLRADLATEVVSRRDAVEFRVDG